MTGRLDSDMTSLPYYQDDFVTLYHGDSLEILPSLDIQASALLTDPPYFKVKKDAWDNQWGGATQFLDWMGEWLDLTKPLLTDNASVWVFASPSMTTAVERVVGQRYRVLNSIRWVKAAGWHQRAELASLRSFLTPWEGIIFAEQLDNADGEPDTLRGQMLAPFGEYFLRQCAIAGRDIKDVAVSLGYNARLGSFWGQGLRFPSADAYAQLVALLGEGIPARPYEDLKDERDHLLRKYEGLRRPFLIDNRTLSTDVWDFDPVKPYKGKHPCEKPLVMLEHMVRTSTREGDAILDPFAGSGSTLEAARNLGRKAIGLEQDERYCEQIANRMSIEPMDIFGEAA